MGGAASTGETRVLNSSEKSMTYPIIRAAPFFGLTKECWFSQNAIAGAVADS